MNKTFVLISIFLSIIVYIIIFNYIFAFLNSDMGQIQEEQSLISGGDTSVGMGDKVSVRVEKQRFYGKIIEIIDSDKKSMLYLFNIIPLPLEIQKISFAAYHLVFLVLLCLVVLFFIIAERRRRENEMVY